MGCAYVKKLDFKTNDIDLSGEITKPHCNEVNNDFSIAAQKKAVQLIDLEKFDFRNLERSNNSKQINKKTIIKSISVNNISELKFSGPIISLLKNKVENYQKKILSDKILIVNDKTSFYKEN
jgi:hypothetical protein